MTNALWVIIIRDIVIQNAMQFQGSLAGLNGFVQENRERLSISHSIIQRP